MARRDGAEEVLDRLLGAEGEGQTADARDRPGASTPGNRRRERWPACRHRRDSLEDVGADLQEVACGGARRRPGRSEQDVLEDLHRAPESPEDDEDDAGGHRLAEDAFGLRGEAQRGQGVEKTASPQAKVSGGPMRGSSLSSHGVLGPGKQPGEEALVSPPSSRPRTQARRSSSGRAIHCHRRTPKGPGQEKTLEAGGPAVTNVAVLQRSYQPLMRRTVLGEKAQKRPASSVRRTMYTGSVRSSPTGISPTFSTPGGQVVVGVAPGLRRDLLEVEPDVLVEDRLEASARVGPGSAAPPAGPGSARPSPTRRRGRRRGRPGARLGASRARPRHSWGSVPSGRRRGAFRRRPLGGGAGTGAWADAPWPMPRKSRRGTRVRHVVLGITLPIEHEPRRRANSKIEPHRSTGATAGSGWSPRREGPGWRRRRPPTDAGGEGRGHRLPLEHRVEEAGGEDVAGPGGVDGIDLGGGGGHPLVGGDRLGPVGAHGGHHPFEERAGDRLPRVPGVGREGRGQIGPRSHQDVGGPAAGGEGRDVGQDPGAPGDLGHQLGAEPGRDCGRRGRRSRDPPPGSGAPPPGSGARSRWCARPRGRRARPSGCSPLPRGRSPMCRSLPP